MTAAERWVMPPIECMPWCADSDGHPGEYTRHGQVCSSAPAYVSFSRMPVWREKGGEFPQQIGVMARKEAEAPAGVDLHLNDIELHGPIPSPYNVLDHTLRLTPSEAVHLAELLLVNARMAQAS